MGVVMAETDDQSHALAMHRAPRCGARTRTGDPCKSPAVSGRRRCRMHGGTNFGPNTPAGMAMSALSTWKHGRRSREAVAARKAGAAAMREMRRLLAEYLASEGSTAR
jgi:hypothetical protein